MTPPNPEGAFIGILADAARIAQRFGQRSYTTLHILLAILRNNSFLREWFYEKQVRFNDLMTHDMSARNIEPDVGVLLARVRSIATTAEQPRKPIHMLFGILSFGPGSAAFDSISAFAEPAALLREIVQQHWLRNPPGETAQEEKDEKTEKRGLAKYGVDFTQRAREGKLRGVTDRDQEISAIVEILARKDMDVIHDEAINNPVLIGEAGTGKTALAKALALLIAQRDSRVHFLWNHRLIYLKLGEIQAGTGMRGSLESKISEILSDCMSEPTILFLDELHVVMGLGKTEGSQGIEETLKPILAEGLSCIGATTTEEWRREIESKNSAFARRWIPVVVHQPDQEKTLRIVHGAVHDLARRHVVHFSEEVLAASVTLGRRYMPYDASPAREIDKILNGVGARVKLDRRSLANVEDVTTVISQITGMPIGTQASQRERLANAQSILSGKVFGQDEANAALAASMQRYFSGMRDPNKPLVILGLGPTGVGKTLSAKTITEEFLFNRLVRLDMSEYQERHTVSRLIGSPPGYIGHDEPGQLTEGIRRMGEGLVLLDEIEKAHADVIQSLLALFDEGRLTDGKGNTVDGKNCIFYMSSNIGSRLFAPVSAGIGFGSEAPQDNSFEVIKQRVIQEARRNFSPELWNRTDLVLVYRPHDPETIRKIAIDMLGKEKAKCQELGITIDWKPEVVEYLALHGYDPLYGARPMKRVIMRDIQTMLAQPILKDELRSGDHVTLLVINGVITWQKNR